MLSSPNSSSVSNWPSLARPTKELNIFATTSSSTAGPTHRAQVNSYVARASNDIDSDDDEVNSEYAPPPTVCSESFGSAIAQALILNNCTSRGSKNKKKKNRNTVLFSMGGRTFDGNWKLITKIQLQISFLFVIVGRWKKKKIQDIRIGMKKINYSNLNSFCCSWTQELIWAKCIVSFQTMKKK